MQKKSYKRRNYMELALIISVGVQITYLLTGIDGRVRLGGGGGTPDSFADDRSLCSMVIMRLSKMP